MSVSLWKKLSRVPRCPEKRNETKRMKRNLWINAFQPKRIKNSILLFFFFFFLLKNLKKIFFIKKKEEKILDFWPIKYRYLQTFFDSRKKVIKALTSILLEKIFIEKINYENFNYFKRCGSIANIPHLKWYRGGKVKLKKKKFFFKKNLKKKLKKKIKKKKNFFLKILKKWIQVLKQSVAENTFKNFWSYLKKKKFLQKIFPKKFIYFGLHRA